MSALPVLDATPAVACCPPLAVQALPSDAAVQLAPLFKALSDPVRLRLLSLIASTTEACVCDLTDAFDVTGATISHHLRVLRETGLVDCERRGTWVYYWIRAEVLGQLGGLLAAVPHGEAQALADTAQLRSAAARPAQQPRRLISDRPDVMRLLSDPLRARIVELLADGPASTTDLVVRTGAKQPNLSGHLRLLRDAGLVVTEPRGRFSYYRLRPEALETTADQLADLAARARANAALRRADEGEPAGSDS
jgi:ArsR family transcriptional regulator, arsenate/arsenite/antimonite-responsive transcriptional repressor